jgi:hypothetical protein
MSTTEAFIRLGIVAFIATVLFAERLREAQVLRLLRHFGRSTYGTVVEYMESEEGHLLTYRFATSGSPALVERTEHLSKRPVVRPSAGQVVQVLYLPSLPSVSRVNLNASPEA